MPQEIPQHPPPGGGTDSEPSSSLPHGQPLDGQTFASTLLLSLACAPLLKQHLLRSLNMTNDELSSFAPPIARVWDQWDHQRRATSSVHADRRRDTDGSMSGNLNSLCHSASEVGDPYAHGFEQPPLSDDIALHPPHSRDMEPPIAQGQPLGGQTFASTLLLSFSCAPLLKQHLLQTLNMANNELASLEAPIARVWEQWDYQRHVPAPTDENTI